MVWCWPVGVSADRPGTSCRRAFTEGRQGASDCSPFATPGSPSRGARAASTLAQRNETLMSNPVQPAGESAAGTGTVDRRYPVQLAAMIFGVVFLLIGILGF